MAADGRRDNKRDKQNKHTCFVYCLGFESLNFSGHSSTGYEPSPCWGQKDKNLLVTRPIVVMIDSCRWGKQVRFLSLSADRIRHLGQSMNAIRTETCPMCVIVCLSDEFVVKYQEYFFEKR